MRIFLAGTGGERRCVETLKKSPYILESFIYFRPWQEEILDAVEDFLLDSGAFSFIQGKNSVNWDEYVERYSEFVRQHQIRHYFELDIDSIVGYEQVKTLRKRLENQVGWQSIPVWHRNRGMEEYKRLCDEYDYIAIGGLAIKEIKPSEYGILPILISEAHRRGTMVHGLGFTKVSLLPRYHFDSVDSTRWNCARFGRIEYFDGRTMQVIDRRKDGMRLKGRSSDVDTIEFTFKEWTKFQVYAKENL